MEALSEQFVDIVRTHLDSVETPITKCTTTYNTLQYFTVNDVTALLHTPRGCVVEKLRLLGARL